MITTIKKCRPSANIHVCEDVYKLTDANGYSCGNVCNECYDEVKAKYNPEIFKSNYNESEV